MSDLSVAVMGGQMLGGGVVILVAVLLWMLYLLPSIMRRARYDAAERNALRLNRALRVLAETSETPDEVRVELSARQARQQQRAAVKAQAEVERLQRERDEIEAEQARLERERELAELEERRHRIESTKAALERRETEREREAQRLADARETNARAHRSIVGRRSEHAERGQVTVQAEAEAHDWDSSREEKAPRAFAMTFDDVARARARRRVRMLATLVAVVGIIIAGWGVWLAAQAAVVVEWAGFVAGGAAMVAVAVVTLRRMAHVARRAAARSDGARTESGAGAVARLAPRRVGSALVDDGDRGWTPRTIPRPLSATAGSQASSVADARVAREQLLAAAREEGLRGRAEQMRPVPMQIDSLRQRVSIAEPAVDPAEEFGAPQPGASPYASMGYVDDSEIDQHLRRMLSGRAAG